jgi:predicted ferric reductase
MDQSTKLLDHSASGTQRRGLRGVLVPERSSVLIAGALVVTTVLWSAGHAAHLTADWFWPWRALSQITVLWSVTLMSITMLAVIRASALEPLFGGLDRGVKLHRWLGLFALLLLGSGRIAARWVTVCFELSVARTQLPERR